MCWNPCYLLYYKIFFVSFIYIAYNSFWSAFFNSDAIQYWNISERTRERRQRAVLFLIRGPSRGVRTEEQQWNTQNENPPWRWVDSLFGLNVGLQIQERLVRPRTDNITRDLVIRLS